jgi:hypothetical protein
LDYPVMLRAICSETTQRRLGRRHAAP